MTDIWDFDWSDWVEPAYPMTGPAFDWTTIRYITIHYPGAPNVLALTFESERAEIRAENRMYWTDPNRGYALGYNAKVFQDGTKWMLRGDVLRCAANGNQALNIPGFAIQIRVANTEDPSPACIDAVRSLVAWCREKAGRHLPINGHRDLKATACPGDRAYALIQAGVFEPTVVIDPPVIFPPTSEEDDMIIVDYGKPGVDWWWTRCLIVGGHLLWVQGKAQEWTEPGSTTSRKLDEFTSRHIQVQDDAHFADLLATYKATTACPSTFAQNPSLTAAWAASRAR